MPWRKNRSAESERHPSFCSACWDICCGMTPGTAPPTDMLPMGLAFESQDTLSGPIALVFNHAFTFSSMSSENWFPAGHGRCWSKGILLQGGAGIKGAMRTRCGETGRFPARHATSGDSRDGRPI